MLLLVLDKCSTSSNINQFYSFVFVLQTFLCRKDLASDLKKFASEKSASALVLMFLHTVPNTDNVVRELVVFSTHHKLQQQVSCFNCLINK